MVDLGKLWSGDHAYFKKVVRDHNGLVARICRAFGESGDDRDDLIQEVWILVYQKRRKFTGNGAFSGWLSRLTANHCRDVYRRRQRRDRKQESFLAGKGLEGLHKGTPDPSQDLEKKEAERALWIGLNALPDRQREAIVLRIIEGKSPGEVAREMGINQGSVRSLIHRGIQHLKSIMGGSE